MSGVYLNSVATAVPDHDIHRKFIAYAPRLLADARDRELFRRAAGRAQVDHRYSFLRPHADEDRLDAGGFYGAERFPDTESRMKFYERHAIVLARRALDRVALDGVTHFLVTTCTGFYAPGLDTQIARHYGLGPSVERTVIGFMGCAAGLSALKLARHIVRSDRRARVAVLSLELCTLHLQGGRPLEEMLPFVIFADGCAAAIVSAAPEGLEIEGFHACLLPDSADQLTWSIGGAGFDMTLSGRVPGTIARALPKHLPAMLGGRRGEEILHWAIHPGGRSILDAARDGLGLEERQLAPSRDILRRFGNMSSASILFVLNEIMTAGGGAGEGCAMAFGPGLTVESMRFATGGA